MKRGVSLIVASLLLLASLAVGVTAQSIHLYDGDARYFDDPPDVVAYANVNHVAPPSGVTITDSGGLWRYYEWIALREQGQWIEAMCDCAGTTAVGVQFYGDANDGWARVLVDGTEVWTGDTYGPGVGPDSFIKYLEVSGLTPGSHTVRVENMGINGGGLGDDVAVYFFGFRQLQQVFLPIVAKGLGGPVEKDIGPEGGKLVHPYGASLELPAGSIPQPLTFSIEVQDSLPAPLPSNVSAVGKAVKFGPSDIYFGIPALIRLPVPSGIDETRVNMYSYKDGEWRLVPAHVEENHLLAGTSSFSWFTIGQLSTVSPLYEHKAFVHVNRTTEDEVIVSLRSWDLAHPDRDRPPLGWSVGLGPFNFWRSDQECSIFPQGTYTFWVYAPRLERTCWTDAYSLGSGSSPYCINGEPVIITVSSWWAGSCFAGNPTGNVPGQPVLGVGSLRFTLRWSAQADLDLHVQAPDGYIWYSGPGPTANGGQLDRDSICIDYGEPGFGVENVYWPAGRAPAGQYTVSVAYFNHCGTGATNVPFRLEVTDDNGRYQSWDGTVGEEYRVLNVPIWQIPSQSKWSTTWTR
jgi:hypothetical protein